MKIEILNPIPLITASLCGFGFAVELDRSATLITVTLELSCPVYAWSVSADWKI